MTEIDVHIVVDENGEIIMNNGTIMVKLDDVVDVVTKLLSGSHLKALVLDMLDNGIEKILRIESEWKHTDDEYADFECGNCGARIYELDYNYCPFCGSKNEIEKMLTKGEAIHILRNANYIGTEQEKNLIELAIKTLEG